jgi:hypothetical protein
MSKPSERSLRFITESALHAGERVVGRRVGHERAFLIEPFTIAFEEGK